MRQTPLSQLLGLRLGRKLEDHVVEARNAGHGWRKIAEDLREKTGEQVSWETLRAWFADELETVVVVRLKDRSQPQQNRRAS